MCFKISWKFEEPGAEGIMIKIRETGQGFAGGSPSGSADAPWITAGGYNFDLYVEGQLYDSIFVKGVAPENYIRCNQS